MIRVCSRYVETPASGHVFVVPTLRPAIKLARNTPMHDASYTKVRRNYDRNHINGWYEWKRRTFDETIPICENRGPKRGNQWHKRFRDVQKAREKFERIFMATMKEMMDEIENESDPVVKMCMTEAVRIVAGPNGIKDKLSAMSILLKYRRPLPASTSNVNVVGQDDWVKAMSALTDDDGHK